ncbi:MAG: DUF3501 family protein [Planctomycetota bacterium]
MKKVAFDEIVSLNEYAAMRDGVRREVMAVKAARRVYLGEHLMFLFENADTIRYQVHEMLRAESRSSEEDVRHELDTYNELIGDEGELGCTLLIGIDDALQRDIVLRKWVELPKHLYLLRSDGQRAYARFDERQIGRGRLSSVQYLKFEVGPQAPTAVGMDLPGMELEVEIQPAAREALGADLTT